MGVELTEKIQKKIEMADQVKKRRTFKKFSYRGGELDKLLDLSTEEFINMTNSRHRRSFRRGVKKRHQTLIEKMRKAKANATGMDKPAPVKTHCRNVCILPGMVGNIIGVYNAEMIGTYFGEYGISYKPVRHGRPGIGATPSSRFI